MVSRTPEAPNNIPWNLVGQSFQIQAQFGRALFPVRSKGIYPLLVFALVLADNLSDPLLCVINRKILPLHIQPYSIGHSGVSAGAFLFLELLPLDIEGIVIISQTKGRETWLDYRGSSLLFFFRQKETHTKTQDSVDEAKGESDN
jgi:hypothetical protein